MTTKNSMRKQSARFAMANTWRGLLVKSQLKLKVSYKSMGF